MKKRNTLVVSVILAAVIMAGCSTVPTGNDSLTNLRLAEPVSMGAAGISGTNYYIDRHYQSETISVGSTIGIISASGSSSVFLATALQESGLNVRQFDLYSMLPMSDIAYTSSLSRFNYQEQLAGASTGIADTAAEDSAGDNAGSTEVNVDELLNRLYTLDDIMIEEQRIEHYLALKTKLKALIGSMNLDYVIIMGSMYDEHDYQTYIYRTSDMDLIFSHMFVADIVSWRKVVSTPERTETLDYSFDLDKEPIPLFDLSYCEFMVKKLDIK